MRFLRDLALLGGAASAGLLVYGSLYETKRLVLERRTISLPRWPTSLSGVKITLLGDFHLRDRYSFELAQRAVALALESKPDYVVLIGDYVGYWKLECVDMLGELLQPMRKMKGNVIAVPGNHDYWQGDASLLAPIFAELRIKLLRNAHWKHGGIQWIGIDSASARRDDPALAFAGVGDGPRILLWHEPDPIDRLPFAVDLQLSGHSHGGQWRFPGWTPIRTKLGDRYTDGFYARDGANPLYVTRGVGTTGPPARFRCPPDVSLLTLVPGERVALVESETVA